MSLRQFTAAIVFVMCWLLSAVSAQAEPVTFSDVRINVPNITPMGGIDLFSNPGLTITTGTDSIVVLSLNISGTGSDTLRITGTATNENGTVPLTQINLLVNAGTTPLFTLNYPPSFQGTTVVLTFDLVNSSPDFVIPSGPNAGQAVNTQTYTFTLVEPVPEPTTLVLVTTGIAGLAVRLYRRRNL